MILKRILNRIKSKKILDLKYLVVELALIFTGITLASKYNDYQNDLQNKKFLKEAVSQLYSELKTDYQVNAFYCKVQKRRVDEIIKLKNLILNKKVKEINSDEIKKTISDLPITINLSNSTLGFKKLEAKNINLIEDSKTKNDLINYYDMMLYNQLDIDSFNKDIIGIKPFMLKYFRNYSLWDRNYDSIIDMDKLINDSEFLNTLNFIISDLKTCIDTNERATLPRSKKLIEELEDDYAFLKEEIIQ